MVLDETASPNEATWRPKYMAEYSMGALDYSRFNDWLKIIENYSAQINSTDAPTLDMIQKYFAGLNVLWKSWRPIQGNAIDVEKVDNMIYDAKQFKRKWEKNTQMGVPITKGYIQEVVDLMDAIHTKIMEIKQYSGLGILVKKNFTTAQKIKMGVQGSGTFEELPEA
jgi:hypothetical protein